MGNLALMQPLAKARSLAVLDLGSGTFRLVLYAYEPGRGYHRVDELREAVALGEGLAKGQLTPEALERGVKALRAFADFLRAVGTEEVRTLATSAIRDSANGALVLQEARRLGLRPELLAGEEEARLGVLAVANGLPLRDALVVDQGGGSAQVSLMRERRFLWGKALPLGALRLTEGFLTQDPPAKAEVRALARKVEDSLEALPLPRGLPLVGLGGNLRAVARIHQKRHAYPLDFVHGYFLPKEGVEELYELLMPLSGKARLEIAGLSPDRARTLPASLVFLRSLLKVTRAPGLWISGLGIREGVLFSHLLPEPHLLEDPAGFAVENLFWRYPFALEHREHVKALASSLFWGLAPLHGYGEEEERLLQAACLLHDIGIHIGYPDHHKHGAYLVLSEPLLGLDHREQALIALLVRYHRRGDPTLGPFRSLAKRGDAKRLARLAVILRLAEMLDRTRSQRVKGLRVEVGPGVRLALLAGADPWVERVEAEKQAPLFQKVYGRPLEVVWEG